MGVSRLFLGYVDFFVSELSMASGIGSIESDECQVDLRVFDAFAQLLAADQRLRRHRVWRTNPCRRLCGYGACHRGPCGLARLMGSALRSVRSRPTRDGPRSRPLTVSI